MFQLNPLALPDATWQHILMVTVSVVLGYFVGYSSKYKAMTKLKDQLLKLDIDLAECQQQRELAIENLATSHAGVHTKLPSDDFRVIEGIGTKIDEVLKNAGINTFNQLSQQTADQIHSLLTNVNPQFAMLDATTWPGQAKLAAEGNWEELRIWQQELRGELKP